MEQQHVQELYNLRKLKAARTLVESAGSPEIAKLIEQEIERRTQVTAQTFAGVLNAQEVAIAPFLTRSEEAFFALVSQRPKEYCSYEWLLRALKAGRHIKNTANESHLQTIGRNVRKKMEHHGNLGLWSKKGYAWYPKEVEQPRT